MELHHTAIECHLPYETIDLLPNTSEHTPPQPQPDRLALDLLTPEGWKAELTKVTRYIPRWFTHPSTNWA